MNTDSAFFIGKKVAGRGVRLNRKIIFWQKHMTFEKSAFFILRHKLYCVDVAILKWHSSFSNG